MAATVPARRMPPRRTRAHDAPTVVMRARPSTGRRAKPAHPARAKQRVAPSRPAPARAKRVPRPAGKSRIRSLRHTVSTVTTTAAAAASKARPAAGKAGRHLKLVPRPRAAINAAVMLVGVVVALMLATVVLHTRLAERQLEIDRLEAAVTDARQRFDVLRSQRAELRSPTRLAAASADLGMQPAPPAEFLAVDPVTLAEVLAGAGASDATGGDDVTATDPLGQIRRVKQSADAP